MIGRTIQAPAGATIIIAVLGLAAGCSTPHSIEAGIWRLKFDIQETNLRQYEQEARDVRVSVDRSPTEDGVEAVKVQYDSRDDSRPVTRTLSGKIRDGEISLEGYDRDLQVRMWGKIFGPDSMGGKAFARGRHAGINDHFFIDSTWTMTLAKPGEEGPTSPSSPSRTSR